MLARDIAAITWRDSAENEKTILNVYKRLKKKVKNWIVLTTIQNL